MNKRALLYILFILCILVGMLILLVINENEQDRIISEKANLVEDVSIVKGLDILNEYKFNLSSINGGDYEIIILSNRMNPISYTTYEDLESIIYNAQRYERIENKKDGKTIVKFSIESIANLVSVLEKSSKGYSTEKLALYTEKDESNRANSEGNNDNKLDIESINNGISGNNNDNASSIETNASENSSAKRELKENELYGKGVIDNFNSHKKDIAENKKYFKIITSEKQTAYTKIEDVKRDIKEDDIFSKSFELDASGNLKGYTFIKVN